MTETMTNPELEAHLHGQAETVRVKATDAMVDAMCRAEYAKHNDGEDYDAEPESIKTMWFERNKFVLEAALSCIEPAARSEAQVEAALKAWWSDAWPDLLPGDLEAHQADMRAALAAASAIGGVGDFQSRVAAAHVALFYDDPTDLAERRDRFGEEANEVQQALGQTREAAHQLVDYTYDRAVGEPEKEIGAAALTLASLCVVGGWDMVACAEADLAALQTPEKIAKVRAKRATRHGRGPLPGIAASAPNREVK